MEWVAEKDKDLSAQLALFKEEISQLVAESAPADLGVKIEEFTGKLQSCAKPTEIVEAVSKYLLGNKKFMERLGKAGSYLN